MDKPKPHTVLIAYYFPPAEGVGCLRPFRFYKYLKKAGYGCDVITASPQLPGAPADISYVPDGVAALWEEGAKGRLSLAAHLERFVRRFLLPGAIGVGWSFRAARRCREIVRRHRGRNVVVISTFPPVGVLLAGLLVAARESVSWVADFRDPIAALAGLVSRSGAFFYSRLELLVFRKARFLIANVENAAGLWRKRYPWTAAKLCSITNGFDPEDRPRARPLPPRNGKCIIHAGNFYGRRTPNTAVEGLARLRENGAPEAAGVRLLLVGSIAGPARNLINWARYDAAVREGWLELQPPVSMEQARRMTEEADGLLLCGWEGDVQVPAKLYDYVCIGRPILAVVPRGSAVEAILEKSGVPHVCIYSDDPAPVVDDKLARYLRLPPDAVPFSSWFENNFAAARLTDKLIAVIDGA